MFLCKYNSFVHMQLLNKKKVGYVMSLLFGGNQALIFYQITITSSVYVSDQGRRIR